MNWTASALALVVAFTYHCIPVFGHVVCNGRFNEQTSFEFVEHLAPGWTLGNSLDAFPHEDSWNNPPVVETTFDDVKNFGFKSVRIPVTWAYHFVGTSNQGDSPDWNVDPAWLQRVSDVVDMVTSRDMHAIVNVQYDSTLWADYTAPDANFTMIQEKFYRLWYQVGEKLACKSSSVGFEALGLPQGGEDEHAVKLEKLNRIFLQAINDSGGRNPRRFVSLSGPLQDIDSTIEWFKKPSWEFSNPFALQVHYHAPYDFTSASWGKTIWGSTEDKTQMWDSFSLLRTTFPDIPIIMADWLVSPVSSEPAARWRYYDFFTRMCAIHKFAPIVWDSGDDILDRDTHTLFDSTGLEIHLSALKGIKNSLPQSSTLESLSGQSSSAFLFHQVGEVNMANTLWMDFHGNNVTSVAVDHVLFREGTGYSTSGQTIYFHDPFLSDLFSSSSEVGVKATALISFSAGARIPIQFVLWDIPTVPVSCSPAEAGSEVHVTVNWKGVGRPAAVAAFKADGSPLLDPWTMYLPPLQRGRTVFGDHWKWNWGQDGITITQSAVRAVLEANQSVTFMIEAFPRVKGNHVNYTLTV